MSEPGNEPSIDVTRLVDELRMQVAREQAEEESPSKNSPARDIDLVPGEVRIRFRPELGFSSKPVVGPAITLAKKTLLDLLFFVLEDLAQQADAAVRKLEAALVSEVAARKRAEEEIQRLDERLARLERQRKKS